MENYVESLLPFAVESKPIHNGETTYQSAEHVLVEISDDRASFCVQGVWIDGIVGDHLLRFMLPDGFKSSRIHFTLEGEIKVKKSHLDVLRNVVSDCVEKQLKREESLS
jgi:hypothetical protein